MSVAFYAPLKPADHPTPSGDRTMARALISALKLGGYDVAVASDLRLYDGAGDSVAQDALFAAAADEAARIIASPAAKTWRVWLTYHNYYKAHLFSLQSIEEAQTFYTLLFLHIQGAQ